MSFQNLRVSENIYSYETMSSTTRFKREAEPSNLANGNTQRRQISQSDIKNCIRSRPTEKSAGKCTR